MHAFGLWEESNVLRRKSTFASGEHANSTEKNKYQTTFCHKAVVVISYLVTAWIAFNSVRLNGKK